jgi:hypothetical protein
MQRAYVARMRRILLSTIVVIIAATVTTVSVTYVAALTTRLRHLTAQYDDCQRTVKVIRGLDEDMLRMRKLN